MRRIATTVIILLCMSLIMAKAAIGEWTAYMAYGKITDIEPAGNTIYVLSSGSLFSYNVNDQNVTIYNKVYPLNDTGIAHIAWCNSSKRLVIIYNNQNIDLLGNNGEVTNINDYYNKSMTGDKTVYNITISGNHAYLCTGFGIMKVNIKDAEISDTYNLGMKVTDCAIDGNMIYAKTSNGVYAGNTSDNLPDRNNWKITSATVSFNDANDITISNANGYTEYIAYDNTNKCYWSNQKDGKLQGYKLDDGNTKTIIAQDITPGGPKYNYFGFLKIHDNKLYSCNGIGWDFRQEASIQIFDIENDTWTTFSNDGIADKLGIRYQDVMSVDVDPRDLRHVVAGTQAGLFEFYNGELTRHWNDENSPIYYHYNIPKPDKNYEVVSSVLFDKDGNLWVANTGSTKSTLLKLTADNTWAIPGNAISAENSDYLKFMGFDNKGSLWIHNNAYGAAAAYRYDPTTETITEYSNFTNEDGVTYSNIAGCRALAEDKDGNIWVGISEGLFVLTPEYLNDPTKGFYQVKVPRNDGTNYADYLLSGVDISAIAIDNANRKWIGTNNSGLYLISADNMVEEKHFTAANSALLSDNIYSIVIDNNTGIVYIGTDKGLCSYQSEASQVNGEMTKDNVWAYPNPVTPEYQGMITVTGLSLNADVKITTSNGVLVAQGRSTAGSFQWDGKDLNGNRVASGIYMVNTATADGNSGTVCKIAVIK